MCRAIGRFKLTKIRFERPNFLIFSENLQNKKLFILYFLQNEKTLSQGLYSLGRSKMIKIHNLESLANLQRISENSTIESNLFYIAIRSSKVTKIHTFESLANRLKNSENVIRKRLSILQFRSNEINSHMGVQSRQKA